MTVNVLWAGPFDGYEVTDTAIREFVDVRADAKSWDENAPDASAVGIEPIAHVRYFWRAAHNRYEWEGVRHGQ